LGKEECQHVKNDIEKTLFDRLMMKSHDEFFDHPSAFRMLEGLIKLVNNFSAEQAGSSYVTIKHTKSHIFMAFNCL